MSDIEYLWNGPGDGPLLVLAPGSGASMRSPWMEDVASALGEAGVRVARFDFPYMREERRRPPDREPILLKTWLEVIAELKPRAIGGKSMGGRIASMLADEAGVEALVCFGYPFHPPGKPEKLRTAHLLELRTPTVICQGRRDPFGTEAEVAGYGLSEAIRMVWVEGDHSLEPRRRDGASWGDNRARLVEEVGLLLETGAESTCCDAPPVGRVAKPPDAGLNPTNTGVEARIHRR